MYAEFFGLRELPFNNTPDPRFFFSTPDHEEALASLVYAVQERKGFVLLTGEVGAGKTLVSRMMLRHFGTQIAFANINHALQSAGDLMESIYSEFELPYNSSASTTQVVRTLHDFLLSRFSQNMPVVLVLDEAQALPIDAFEQLRMIGNLEADDAKLLQIVILGQPELQVKFASPQLRQLRQRVFRTFHLPALSCQLTEGYIRHRLTVAGTANLDVFSPDAIDGVHEHSQGLPRLINTICDNAMLSAYSADRRWIDRPFINSVVDNMMTLEEELHDSAGATQGQSRSNLASARSASDVHRPASNVQSTLIENLSRRLGELELRIAHPPSPGTASRRHPSRAGEDNARTAPVKEPRYRQDRVEPEQKVSARSAEPGRQQELVLAQAQAVQAQQVQANLKALIASGSAILDRAEAAAKHLGERERRVQSVVSKVQSLLGEVRSVHAALNQTQADHARKEKSARAVHQRLVTQTDRSRHLCERLGAIVDRLVQRDGDTHQPTLRLLAAAPVRAQADEEAGLGPTTAAAKLSVAAEQCVEDMPASGDSDPDRLRKALCESRGTLSDLRALAHGPTVSASIGAADADGVVAATLDPDLPTSRLAQDVEDLLALVGPIANASVNERAVANA